MAVSDAMMATSRVVHGLAPGITRAATTTMRSRTAAGASVHGSRPPNANSSQPIVTAIDPAAIRSRAASDRRFGVVVLVLVAVVAGVIVLVPREVDLVQDDRRIAWTRLHHGF